MKPKSLTDVLFSIDTIHPRVSDLQSFYNKRTIMQAIEYKLIDCSSESKVCTLTDRGRALMEKGIEDLLLDSKHRYKSSVLSALCCAVMTAVLALNTLDAFGVYSLPIQQALICNLCIGVGTLLYLVSIGISSRSMALAAIVVFVSANFVTYNPTMWALSLPVFLLGALAHIHTGRR